MQTNLFTSTKLDCFCSACFAAVCLNFSATTHAAPPLLGNQSIIADNSANPPEAGNLVISGDLSVSKGLDLGTTGLTGNPVSAFQIEWDLASKSVNLDITDPVSAFTWRDNFVGSTLVRKKMTLSTANHLQIFKEDGAAPGITLDPNTGSLTLAGSNSGIYSSSGSVMTFNSTGNATFATRPTFSDGINFGSGQILNNPNVSYMRGLMTNFGYKENSVTATLVKKVNITNATILSATTSGDNQSGRLYVVGSFSVGADFNGGQIVSAGSTDGFVAKLYASGAPEWIKPIGGEFADTASSVSVDGSGNVYVVGTFNTATTSLGGANLTSSGSSDGYLAKFNSNGAIQWAKSIGGLSNDSASSVKVDSSGNVFVAGTFEGTTVTPETSIIASAGASDGYLAKFNASGAVQWMRPIGGGQNDTGLSVSLNSNGDPVVCGNFIGATANLGASNITSAGSTDGYLAKYDSFTGTVQWAKPVGGMFNDSAISVAHDSANNILFGGTFEGTITNLGSPIPGAGGTDGFIAKLNQTGIVIWATPVGGTGSDTAVSVSLDTSDNVYVGGRFQAATTNLGTANLIGGSGNNGYLLRLNTGGSIVDSAVMGRTGVTANISCVGALVWNSDVYAWGTMLGLGVQSSSIDFGDKRISRGGFLIGWPAMTVVTPPLVPSAKLSWGGASGSGTGSTALGGAAFAEGSNSVALGNGVSTGFASLSSGNGLASGSYSSSLGSGTALGAYSVVLGSGIASGTHSVACGPASSVSGPASLAGGTFQTGSNLVEVSGTSSIAWGQKLKVTGSYAQAFGLDHTVPGNCSTAFGWGNKAQAAGSFVVGSFNISQGSSLQRIETDDAFVIGNGTSDTARSNAITTLKNGQTTLTNKAWKADSNVTPTTENSNGQALVVEGHTVMKGATTLEGQVIISVPQGDISMGIYGN